VEGVGCTENRNRIVSRLRVRLQSEKGPTLGKKLGDTGTDSAMIGVCDIKAFDKACGRDSGDEVQKAIESQTEDGFGVIRLKKLPGAVMPFVPTGSDGSGPVFALMSGRKCVGIELPFTSEDDEAEGKGADQELEAVSLLGEDRDGFITRRLADGGEVSFWFGGDLKAGSRFCLWAGETRGPVDYRIRQTSSGSILKDWSPMKKVRGEDATFCASETLAAGQYEFDLRIGEQEFSALKLTLA
jgi:hypothetical protein